MEGASAERLCMWRVFIWSEREQDENEADAAIPRKGFRSFDYFAAAREKEFVFVINLFPSQGEHSVLTTNKINFVN